MIFDILNVAFIVRFYLAWAEARARRRAKASFWLSWMDKMLRQSVSVITPSFSLSSAAVGY